MMSDKKQKMYAVTLTVKPKPDGISKYSSKTYRGFSLASNPAEAKEMSIQIIVESFKELTKPVITRDEVIIRDCKCHEDFFTKMKEE